MYVCTIHTHTHTQEWDIDALEESTRYDGFNPEHPVIV